MNIGARIKELREKKGINGVTLANLLNTSQQTISNYENNKTEPSFSILKDICEIFDITLSEFFSNPKEQTTISLSPKDIEDLETGRKVRNLPTDRKKSVEILINYEEQAATQKL